ncbi:MAG: glycoside hydrolase family 3 protein [Sphingobacteriales bacterium]|nr:MAG: glycoside hydrolase family 3 protein [Sphingobacteriales bacterium]
MTSRFRNTLGFTALVCSMLIGTPWNAQAQIFPLSQQPMSDAARKMAQDVLRKRIDSIYNQLTPDQRAAQLIMVASSTFEKIGTPYSTAKKLVATGIADGVVFLKGATTEFRKQTQELTQLRTAQQLAPLFACDCEPSLFQMKWMDAPAVLKTNTLTTPQKVQSAADVINMTMQATGVNLNFAPVADIGSNKAVINNRAFSGTADSVAARAIDFVRATQAGGIGATVKHFPGHGNVVGDSHKQQVFIEGTLTELETFRKIISQSNPAAVMIGHIVVRNNPTYATNGLPASLSPVIIQKLLRGELGYDGLITTDALGMEGVRRVPDADFKALQAGADLALMPVNPVALHQRIVKELQAGGPLSEQLAQSVKRVIRYKLQYPAGT